MRGNRAELELNLDERIESSKDAQVASAVKGGIIIREDGIIASRQAMSARLLRRGMGM